MDKLNIIARGTDLVATKLTTLTNMLEFYRKELIDIAYEMVDDPGCLQEGVVYYIVDGKDYSELPNNVRVNEPYIVKVNGMDQWSPLTRDIADTLLRIVDPQKEIFSMVTIHVFHSVGNGVSFPTHTDPSGVLVYILDGCNKKRFILDEQEHDFLDKKYLHLPAYVPHRGINDGSNLMLSIGFEYYLKDRLVADV